MTTQNFVAASKINCDKYRGKQVWWNFRISFNQINRFKGEKNKWWIKC